jgi:hypothetical protein
VRVWACPSRCSASFGCTLRPGKQRGAGVPEVVPADRGEASASEERLEVAVDYVLDVQGSAYLCGENEAKEKESSPSV